MDKIGALWGKVSKNNVSYLSGYVEIDGVRTNVVVFVTKEKKEKSPDYNIFKSEPLKQEDKPKSQPTEDDFQTQRVPTDDTPLPF